MKVNIKRLHSESKIPKYAKNGDAGMDLTVVDKEFIKAGYIRYSFGLAIEIPKGYVGLIFPRSSIYKTEMILSNSVGVIDSGYRGELMAVMQADSTTESYNVGDRACQLVIMPYPTIEFNEVDELSTTERGSGGYGSTGKN